MNKEIEIAIGHSNTCQRNWDREKTIPEEDLTTMLTACLQSPSKQNETHYKVFVYKNPEKIYNIYRKTKHFTLYNSTKDILPDGKTKFADMNVRNSQVYANILFAFCDDWDQEISRTAIHKIVDDDVESANNAFLEREKQKYFSVGVAVGELVLSANLLGYRTGICSAFWPNEMEELDSNLKDLRLLVGVGYPHPDKDRKEHEEVCNKDIWNDVFKTGADDEKWLFPTFEKNIKLEIIE